VIYVVASAVDYPSRISAQCLNDCARLFVARVQVRLHREEEEEEEEEDYKKKSVFL
jgi:hypothetical protein